MQRNMQYLCGHSSAGWKVRCLIFGAYLLMCSACAPIPHFITQAPKVSGSITDNGDPLIGVSVLMTHEPDDRSCRMAKRSSIADASGSFEMEGIKEFRLFTTMGDRIYDINVCIVKNGNTYLGYTDVGFGYPPDSINLQCNINKDSQFVDKNRSEADIDRLAVCVVVK